MQRLPSRSRVLGPAFPVGQKRSTCLCVSTGDLEHAYELDHLPELLSTEQGEFHGGKSGVDEHLGERATPGLHAAVLATVQRHGYPPPCRVLDLGAGSGAWAARLAGVGYNVVAVERDEDVYRFKGARLVVADLDVSLGDPGTGFDVVTAIEVIEHLESPRQFLRRCSDVLRIGGILVLTTPNIENVASRLLFLRTGYLRHFGPDRTINDATHITPIHSFLLGRLLESTDLEIIEHGFNRSVPTVVSPWRQLAVWAVAPIAGGLKGGDNHIFVMRKRAASGS